ncbi:MAG: hypothetical protein HY321_05540 [Armatimonadetes bacterium]|nr:hypothetical protein [Armatimonadota bacterium]
MSLFLFLDDWFLDAYSDVVRRFPTARYVRHIEPPEAAVGTKRPHWNVARGCYEVAATSANKNLFMMESADGTLWERGPALKLRTVGDVPAGSALNLDRFYGTGGFDARSIVLHDPHDVPERRYKLLLFPYVRGIEGGPGVVDCSADGTEWTIHFDYRWYTQPKGSDCTNCLFYNPRRKVWQAICRRWNNDRRIAMTQSADLEHWSEPRVIVQPDALDSPLLQLYGMPVMEYEGYFIGGLQCYQVPHREEGPAPWSKWAGFVEGQLAYSYDGELWLRPHRNAFVPRNEPGCWASSSVYPVTLRPDGKRFLINALGPRGHHASKRQESRLVEYELRRDGFAYFESLGNFGRLVTRCLVPNAGATVTLNYAAPDGRLQVQALDAAYAPVPGYTFAECSPLTGDEIEGGVRWKSRADLSPLAGQRIRLEFRMADARLYAIRSDCKLGYTALESPIDWL